MAQVANAPKETAKAKRLPEEWQRETHGPAAQAARKPDRRIRTDRRIKTGDTGTDNRRESDEQPPREIPYSWAKERQDYEIRIAELKREKEELESQLMTQQKASMLTQYGEHRDLAVIKERVALAPYGEKLDNRGKQMVAQIAYMLDWNPFFDLHAFASKGKLVIMPDYKKLLSMVREQTRINYRERPMTSKEREQWGVVDGEVAFMVEITEVDIFLEYAQRGVAESYNPVLGIGIWRPGDNIPATWTAEMVAKKRGLRNGLSQLASYKIVTDRFREALQGAGFAEVGEDDDGFTVELPETASVVEWWPENKQRQTFWIEMGKLGYDKKSDVATLLRFEIANPNNSNEWAKHMAQFPNVENALAYARVCAENAKQEAEEAAPGVIEGEIVEDKPEPAAKIDPPVCANCEVMPAVDTPAHGLRYCTNCSKAIAEKEDAKKASK